ncbi:MAG: TolC family protein [Pseudomonadales bacterium]
MWESNSATQTPGRATALEVNSAVIGAARAQTELAEAERQATLAQLDLAEVLGRDPTQTLAVAGRIDPWNLELPDQPTLLNAAVHRRGDLAAAAARVEAARQELRLSRRQLIPNLTVFGFYEEEEGAEITGFGASMPLPLLHRYDGEREEAAGRLEEAQLLADEQRLQVRRDVLVGLANYRAARREAELLGNEMLARAEENLALVQEAFAAGKVGAPAITSAQDNLISVRRSYLDVLSALIRAVTDLESATGGLITLEANETAENNS